MLAFVPVLHDECGEMNAVPTDAAAPEILLVDDMVQVRSIVKLMLEEEGFQIAMAERGIEALRLFGENPRRFSLVLLDWSLPDMPGLQLAEQLRHIRPAMPVIFITGHPPQTLGKALDHTQSHYLAKPFTPDQLYESVRAALGAA